MGLIRTLSDWLDRRGDLTKGSARIFQLGPLLVAAIVLTIIWNEVSRGVIFWVAGTVILTSCLIYYSAFLAAFARQRERFYQRKIRPQLDREHRGK